MRRFIAVLAMLMAATALFAESDALRRMNEVIGELRQYAAEVIILAGNKMTPSERAIFETIRDLVTVQESAGKTTAESLSYGDSPYTYVLAQGKFFRDNGKSYLFVDFGAGETATLPLGNQTGQYAGATSSGIPLTLYLVSTSMTGSPDRMFPICLSPIDGSNMQQVSVVAEKVQSLKQAARKYRDGLLQLQQQQQ